MNFKKTNTKKNNDFEDKWKNKSIKTPKELKQELVDHFSTLYKYTYKTTNNAFEMINKNALDYLVKNYIKIYKTDECKEEIEFHNYQYNKLRLLQILNHKGVYPVGYKQNGIKCRQYSINAIGIQSFTKEIRGALCKDLYIDIDLKNCHPNILYKICFDNKIDCPFLKLYVDDPKKYRKELEVINQSVEDEDSPKLAFIKIIYGMKKKKLGLNTTEFLDNFYDEYRRVAALLKCTAVYKKAMKLRYAQNKKNHINRFVREQTVTSDICRSMENLIIEDCREWLVDKKVIDKRNPVFILMYDGIMILKNDNFKIEELNSYIQNKYGYSNFVFVKKTITTNVPNVPKLEGSVISNFEHLKSLRSMRFFEAQQNTFKNATRGEGVSNPNNVIEGDKIIDEEKIDISDDMDAYETLICKSPMGSGKTHSLEKFLQKHPDKSVLIVSFRRSLCSKHFSDLKTLGFKYYEDINGFNRNSGKNPRVITQVNSLHQFRGMYDYLILDEFASTYNMLYSFCDSKIEVFNALNSYVKNCEKVIVLDALLRENNVNYIKKMRPDKKSIVIVNEHKLKATVIAYSKASLLAELVNKIENYDGSEATIITSSSKTWLDNKVIPVLEHYKIPKGKIIYINRDSIRDNAVSDEENEGKIDVGAVDWSEYDFIIYTPTIVSGVSIEVPIHNVFCYFTSRSCPADLCFQMMGRGRNIINKTYHVAVSQVSGGNYPVTKKDVKMYINNYRNLGHGCLEYLCNIGVTSSDKKIVNIIEAQKLVYDNYAEKYIEDDTFNGFVEYIINNNLSKNDLRSELFTLFKSVGYDIKIPICGNEVLEGLCCKNKGVLSKIFKDHRRNVLNINLKEYQEAPLLDDIDFEELKLKQNKNPTDKIRLNVHTINQVCNKKVKDMDAKELRYIIDNYNGVYYKKYVYDNVGGDEDMRMYLNRKVVDAQFDIDKLSELSDLNLKDLKRKDDLNTIYMGKRDFYLRTLMATEIAGIFTDSVVLPVGEGGKELSITEAAYNEFSDYINENKDRVILLFESRKKDIENVKSKKKRCFYNYTFVNKFLKYVGLKITTKRVRKDGVRKSIPFIGNSYILC